MGFFSDKAHCAQETWATTSLHPLNRNTESLCHDRRCSFRRFLRRRRAMLRLRSCIAARLLSGNSAAPISPLHRLLSAAAAVSPSPGFNVEEYLVERGGLTRAQALKASTKLTHLKSPTNPDAVLAFLASLGLSGADVAAVVAKDPKFLCSGVDTTLGPNLVGLTGHGLSTSEIARLVSLAPLQFRRKSIVSNLPYFLSIFGCYDNLLRALKRCPRLLGCSLEKVAKPNVAVLRECGLGACDIAKLCIAEPRLLTANLERVQAMVACADAIGVPRGSAMFRHALHGVAFLNEGKIAAQEEYLKKALRWSDAEVSIAVSKLPMVLRLTENMLQSKPEFLISEVGLEPAYLAHCPALLCYSLEGRLRPRYYVLKFLKENGLLDRDRSYYAAVTLTDKVFVDKYIAPHNEAAPYLAQDYATACKGEVPTRFRFT